jgi:uncharacterized protein YjbJ (UPF0337 family)
MKSSTKDKAKGKMHQVTGRIKEIAGNILNNDTLKAKGRKEKNEGKVQEKVGQVKNVLDK